MKSIRKISAFFLFLFAGSLLLLWPAFLNKFPIVRPDSLGYMLGSTMSSRSVGYYLFIKASSCHYSLWLVIFCQSLITSYLLLRIPVLFYKSMPKIEGISFINLLILILLTDISIFICWIQPDIFTGWIFLACWLFFLTPHLIECLFLSVLIIIGISAHNSHILIAFFLIFVFSTIGLLYKNRDTRVWNTCVKIILSILIGFMFNCFINMKFEYSHRFQLLSPRGSSYFVAKLATTDILSRTLADYCSQEKWEICRISGELKKHVSNEPSFYLWAQGSPFRKDTDLLKNQKQVNEIALYALKRYPLEIIIESLKDTLRMLSRLGFKSVNDYNIKTWPSFIQANIDQYKGFLDMKSYVKSYQYKGNLLPSKPLAFDETSLELIFILYAILLISVNLRKGKHFEALIILASLLFILVNDLITASISGAYPRYHLHVFWILPYVLFTMSLRFLYLMPGLFQKWP